MFFQSQEMVGAYSKFVCVHRVLLRYNPSPHLVAMFAKLIESTSCVMSVHLLKWKNESPTRWIYVNFCIEDAYKNL